MLGGIAHRDTSAKRMTAQQRAITAWLGGSVSMATEPVNMVAHSVRGTGGGYPAVQGEPPPRRGDGTGAEW